MSIEVRVPEEIKDYKESIVAGLSIRQLACGGVALGCGIPTFLLLRNINMDLATYATMVVVIPAFCVGFIKKGGYTFEKYIKIKIRAAFGKNKRTYETKGDAPPIEVEEYRAYYQQLAAEQAKTEENGTNKKEVVKNIHSKGKRNSKKAQRKDKREYEIAEITAQSLKRTRKTAYKAIKTAGRTSRKKKS